MKFGLVIPLWFLFFPLFSQNCEKVAIPPVRYFENTDQGSREIHSYFVPCSESKTLSVVYPSNAWIGYIDPDPTTSAGIIMIVLQRDPGAKVVSVSEFEALIYRDVNGLPLYYTDPDEPLLVSQLMDLGNVSNEYVLMPVLVSNISGTDLATWFEEDCVRLFTEYGLTMINNPTKEYEFIHFDEITFTQWPEDTSVIDFFDFTFTDQETGQTIPYAMTDNRSFRLEFPKAQGIFNYDMSWKGLKCNAVEIGINWAFPTVKVQMDTVAGFRNIEKCVPVRAFNFESVTGFEMTLTWNSDSADFSAIENIHPALEPYLKVGNATATGNKQRIHIELPSGTDTLTLSDSTILFEWCGRPLVEVGETVKVDFATESNGSDTHFMIYDLETDSETHAGGITVQEDRELIYDLNQLCNTRDGKHRIKLDVINDEAYPYMYSFHSPMVPDSVIRSIPFIIPDVPAGQYEFTIRDSFGFEITEDFIVKEHIPPDFKLEIDANRVIQPSCIDPLGGQIAVSIDPQDQNYQLQLLNKASTFMGDSIFGLEPGNYIIQVEDEEGCVDTLNYTLNNPSEINVSWDAGSLVLCPGDDEVPLQLTDLNAPPDPSLQYQLAGGAVMDADAVITIADSGSYPLQLWNDDGCTLDTTVVVRAGPKDYMVWDTTSIRINQHDTLNFTSSEPAGLTDVSWRYNGVVVGGQSELQYQPQESGVVNFIALVYDRCFYIDSLMVHVIVPDHAGTEYEFPNAFTPNDDGVNDYYRVLPARNIQKVLRMEVYDRYGNFVFQEDYTNESNNQVIGWDGRYAGVDAAPGIYVVQVKLQLVDGREKQIGIDVLLIR